MRVGALVQQPLSRFAHGSGVASCGPRRARVCGALALTHSHTPSLVAWQEEREVARRAALTQTARPRSICTAQLGQPVPQDSPSTKSSCSGGVGSASGGLFCARFALNHAKKADFFLRGSAPAPPELRACAGVHPLNRGQTPSYTCRQISPFDRMHSKKSAI